MNVTFWQDALTQLNAGQHVFFAFVANNTNHSPGTRGAKLWVSDDSVGGTIGGGVMEHDIIEKARRVIGDGTFDFFEEELLVHRPGDGLSPGKAKRSGLFCAGEQQMVYAVVRADSDIHRSIFPMLADGNAPGFLEISSDGWRVAETIWDKQSPPIGLDNGVYRELIVNPFRVAIFGGGHCGTALGRVLVNLGYTVTIVDPREIETPDGVHHLNRQFEQAAAEISSPELTHAIVMTANFPSDVDALNGMRGIDFPFIGVMGSKAKISRIRASIPEGVNEILTAPIGLEMVSNTPEEIAVSVAAQLLQIRPSLWCWT